MIPVCRMISRKNIPVDSAKPNNNILKIIYVHERGDVCLSITLCTSWHAEPLPFLKSSVLHSRFDSRETPMGTKGQRLIPRKSSNYPLKIQRALVKIGVLENLRRNSLLRSYS